MARAPVASADDVDKAPAPAPAAVASATRPASDPAAEALRAARTFLRAVGDSDDNSAYKLMASEYRNATTPEQFAERMATLRERVDLSGVALPPVHGWVLVNPEPGQARQGAFTVGYQFSRMAPDTPMTDTTLGVRVVEQRAGGWLVTEVRAIDRDRDPIRFTEPVIEAARLGSDVSHITSTIEGVVTAVKDGTLTIRPDPRPQDPTRRQADRTLKLDEKTDVVLDSLDLLAVDVRRSVPHHSFAPGSLADIKPGVRVSVETSPDDERAAGVEVRVAEGL
jgi:hypothetical protein